jgi:hypothetical protein
MNLWKHRVVKAAVRKWKLDPTNWTIHENLKSLTFVSTDFSELLVVPKKMSDFRQIRRLQSKQLKSHALMSHGPSQDYPGSIGHLFLEHSPDRLMMQPFQFTIRSFPKKLSAFQFGTSPLLKKYLPIRKEEFLRVIQFGIMNGVSIRASLMEKHQEEGLIDLIRACKDSGVKYSVKKVDVEKGGSKERHYFFDITCR